MAESHRQYSCKSGPILDCLRESPLLVGDLVEANTFDRSKFALLGDTFELNFDQKLGHIYEDAMAVLIEQSPGLELLASGLQVMNEVGRTLGELDFLIYDHTEQVAVHLELAVKVYLAFEQGGHWIYPGPDARDNWQRKLTHMKAHQLVMSRTEEGQKLLQDRFHIESTTVRQLIYGRLFRPMSADCPLPEGVSVGSLRGRWLYGKEWSVYMLGVDEVYFIPKPLWPVPMSETTRQSLEIISTEELFGLGEKRAVMFTLKHSTEVYFLVPNDWPNLCDQIKK